MLRPALLGAAILLAIAGCTSDDSPNRDGSDPTATPSTSSSSTAAQPAGPDCADIWQAGETLPTNYTECVAGGVVGDQDVTECKDGTSLIAFANTFYAVTGGEIRKPDVAPMQDTEEYGNAFSACTGE